MSEYHVEDSVSSCRFYVMPNNAVDAVVDGTRLSGSPSVQNLLLREILIELRALNERAKD